MLTSISIYSDDLPVWKHWCKHYCHSSADLMRRLMKHVELQQQQAFYNSLPKPVKIAKPLSGKKIIKNYEK
jgi:hypothetical protein